MTKSSPTFRAAAWVGLSAATVLLLASCGSNRDTGPPVYHSGGQFTMGAAS